MEQIFNENGYPLDMSKLELLSTKGSEFTVYRYFRMVIKIYKKDYPLSHLSLEELNILKRISTQRILLPSGVLWNINGELIGYEMPYISGEKSIECDSVYAFFEELEMLKKDLDLLCSKSIILRDIDLSNTIYNGKLYLIDPGNYLIGDLNKIIFHLNLDSLTPEERQKLLIEWNYNKINVLIDMLLFLSNPSIDPFRYRQIVQFLMRVREENNLFYNLEVLKMFFNQDLSIGEAIDSFIKKYIKDDPEERKLFLSLYNK